MILDFILTAITFLCWALILGGAIVIAVEALSDD